MGTNAVGGGVKRPEADFQQAESVEVCYREAALFSRQNNNRNMSKKPIAVRLKQCAAPIVQFGFKCSDCGFGERQEMIPLCQTSRGWIPRFPTDCHTISDAVAIGRYFTGDSQRVIGRTGMYLPEAGRIRVGETARKSVFAPTAAFAVRQVAVRLVKPQLLNANCCFRWHGHRITPRKGNHQPFETFAARTK